MQRSGNIVFAGSISAFTFSSFDIDPDPAGQQLRHLAKIFSFIDQDIINCWNSRCDPIQCSALTRSRVIGTLSRLQGSASRVFGEDANLGELSEIQKADLLITWQWLRNRIWRLAASHGLTKEGEEQELSVDYVVEVAATTVAICKRLSVPAMEAHGTGFVSDSLLIGSNHLSK